MPLQSQNLRTILVYMILNGKGGLTGFGAYEYSLVSILF